MHARGSWVGVVSCERIETHQKPASVATSQLRELKRQTRLPLIATGDSEYVTDVILDEADGLDWATAVRCDFLHALPKDKFLNPRGRVTELRRQQILRPINRCLRFPI